MKVLITGGTGFIGKKIIREIHSHSEIIYLLVRPASFSKAKKDFSDLNKIIFVKSDITLQNVIIDEKLENKITDNVDVLIHCAASYDLKITYNKSYLSNIIGTQNICSLAKKLKKLKTFHYFSTIAVAGEYEGFFKESQIDENIKFSNAYAETKMSAEIIFKRSQLRQGVKKRIYRPGIVVGDSKDGQIDRIDGPYYFIELLNSIAKKSSLLKKTPFLFLPYNPEVYLPIIPIDILVSWIGKMLISPSSHDEVRTYHLVDGKQVLLKDFIKDLLKYYKINSKIIPIKHHRGLSTMAKWAGLPESTVNFMYNNIIYDSRIRSEDFPDLTHPPFKDYKEAIFSGANTFLKERKL